MSTIIGTVSNPAESAALEATKWLLDVGPFFDRFDHFTPGTKLAILSSTDAQVQAVVKDLQVRKWVDLQRSDVAAGINLLIAKGISGVNTALRDWIVSTSAEPIENLALRKTYF